MNCKIKKFLSRCFFTIIIFIVVSCSKDKIVEPALFTISGIVENENGDKISTDIFLISDDTLTTKSDTDGSFIFENISAGDVKLIITDSKFIPLDTLLSLSRNIDLILKLKNKFDFFPMKVGNWWEYNFDYRPSQSSYIWQNGNVKWEIWDNDTINNTVVFQIRERINATVINKENPDGTVDTSYIKNKMNYFNLIEYDDGFVLFSSSNFFNRRILLRRYYEDDVVSLILNSGPDWSSHYDSNLVALDEEFHKIKLLKNIGIDSWKIDNSHNGGPDGYLVLVNYEIK